MTSTRSPSALRYRKVARKGDKPSPVGEAMTHGRAGHSGADQRKDQPTIVNTHSIDEADQIILSSSLCENGGGDLMTTNTQVTQLRAELSLEIKSACRKLGIPCVSPKKIADYTLSLASQGRRKKAVWSQRKGRDETLSPIEFMEKHWGAEIRSGNFYQVDLREADLSLFEAVRKYCRNRSLDPKQYLPPPLNGKRIRRQREFHKTVSRLTRRKSSELAREPNRSEKGIIPTDSRWSPRR